MGLFWELIQLNQQHQQYNRTASLEDRVRQLETELDHTRSVLQALLQRLETHFGEDLNSDGHIG